MKRAGNAALAALLLGAAAALGGCSMQIEERAALDVSQIAIEPGAQPPQQDAYAQEEHRVTLYFLDAQGTTLVPTTRSIAVEKGMSTAEAALRALLGGPREGERGVYWPQKTESAGERLFEHSGSVATVDLPARMRELPQEQIYAVRQAVTNTLTEFSDIAYVNVLIGGREEGFDLGASMPVGTLSRISDHDVGAQYARLDELRQQGDSVSRAATLYFPTEDGMLLAEVRSLALEKTEPIECLYALLEEFGKGASSKLACAEVPAPLQYIMEMPDIVRTADGAYRAIELQLDDALLDALKEQGLTLGVYIAALTDTLMGFVPGVEGLQVSVGGARLEGLDASQTPDGIELVFAQTLATREDFARYVGAPCTLYAPEEGGKLVRVQRTIAQESQHSPRQRLWAQIRLLQQNGLLGDALSEEDILAVSAEETDILVHLSDRLADALSDLSAEQERAAVYAMVNTLTEGKRQQSVRFFFDGEQRQTLAGGLEMRGSLVRNPGMVVK